MTSAAPVTSRSRPPEAGSPFRFSAALALLGAAALGVGTWLHPAGADPADSAAAFAEYAATSRATWVASHLLQLVGVTGVTLAMILMAGALAGASTSRVQATRTLGAASLAVAATLQAVDGVALKVAVDRWVGAPDGDKPALFAAALAVRSVEIGLDGLWALMLAATALSLAAVLLTAPYVRRSLALLTGAAAAISAVGGVLFCLQGFSPAAMNVSTAGAVLGFVAVTATALMLARQPTTR